MGIKSRLYLVVLSILALAVGVLLSPGKAAGPEIALPRFVDVAARSHFIYTTNNGFTTRKYFITPMCGGVGVLDYDGDGLVDIFLTNGAELPSLKKANPSFYNCLLRNRGNGTFEDVTVNAGLTGKDIGYSFGAAVGDYDNDGHPDIFVSNAGANTLYHNNGNGTFTDVTTGSGLDKPANTLSVGAAWFDYDNDGLLDLFVSNYTVWTPQTDIECRDTQERAVYCSPKRYVSVPDRLYHNLGNGKFEDVTQKSGFAAALGKGMGIAIADFNHDGLMDVFVSNDTERSFLFINKGPGKFVEAGLLYGVAYNDNGAAVSGMGADARDYDNDGWPDIFYNDLEAQNFALFRNDSGRSFTYSSPQTRIEALSRRFSGWSNAIFDFDNDGWKDIYSANGDVDYIGDNAKQHDTMWRNIHGLSFEDVSEQLGADFVPLGYHRGSAVGDLNNDGALDLIVTALGERPRILLNSGNTNHWMLLELIGEKSNRDAIGASVRIVTQSGRALYNHVTTSGGFMSSSDRRVHFGLGRETAVREIEIHWPSGIVQTIANPKIDRMLRIVESQQ